MVRGNLTMVVCLSIAGVLACAGLGCTTDTSVLAAGEGHETASKDVTMDQVPKAAQETIKKEAGKNQIRELEEKVIDGKTVYAAAWVVGGKEVEVQVAADGKVTFRKTEAVGEEDAGGEKPAKAPKAKGELPAAKADKAEKSGQPKSDKPAKAAGAAEEKPWRDTFKVDKKNLVSVGRNPYFSIVPGTKLHLTGGGETVVISVLKETKTIDGVECRVVEERETKGGKLSEISRNYFAIDKNTNDLYYFGEDVDEYDESGKVAGHGGGWLSGEKGARFGLFLPAGPKIGQRFYQEIAPKVAMDRCEVVALDATLKTPLKTFTHCLRIRETSGVESGTGHKWFVAGVGLVGDDEMRLTKVEEP